MLDRSQAQPESAVCDTCGLVDSHTVNCPDGPYGDEYDRWAVTVNPFTHRVESTRAGQIARIGRRVRDGYAKADLRK